MTDKNTTKGGCRRPEKSHKVLMNLKSARLVWAGAVQKWWRQESGDSVSSRMVTGWCWWKSGVGGVSVGVSSKGENSLNGLKRHKMARNGSKRLKMAQNGSKWLKIA